MKKFLQWLLGVALTSFSSDLSAQGYLGAQKLYYGAAYYPEAWDTSQIDRDIRYMKELKMNVMRIGEFAWSTMEPEEGKYNFGWLHRVIEKLKSNGIDVILGTPTATPPAWMLEKYPSMLLTSSSGQVLRHGGRRDCSYASKKYREKSIAICEAMSREFGSKSGVIGWQTDNEFGLSFDYSMETQLLWHQWLAREYGTIDVLNKRWNTVLWSQTYQNFSQVPMPRFTKKDGGEAGVWHHPSLVFSWKKFCNLQIAEFQKLQEVALHKYSKLPVTHDSMPGQPVDYETVMSSCDFMSMNCYHGYRGYEIVPPNWDRMRAMKKGFHWLFETAPSHSGGDRTWYNHEPLGSERAFLWLNVALGGQGSMFWLWQQHRAGQEMTHGAILSVWGKPFANFPMLKKIGEEFETASEFLMQNPVADARVAIVYSHQAHFGLEIEPYVGDLKYYNDWNQRFALPLWKSFLHRDVIYPSQDLKQYKLLFVPMLPFASSDFRSRLKSWVEAGGTVILGPMTGYRDQDWAAFTEYATGNLEAWTGIETQERMPVSSIPVDPLLPVRLDVTSISLDNKPVCGLWTESLKSNTGKAIAIYSDGLLKGKPAIMENRVGKGKVVVLGTDPGKEMIRKLCLEEARKLDILPEATGEEGVIVSPRLKKGWVLVNLENSPRKITIPEMGSGVNILDGKKISSDAFTLDPYAVMVVRRP